MGQDQTAQAGELFTGIEAQGGFADIEEKIAHVDDEAAIGIARFEHLIELGEETFTESDFFLLGAGSEGTGFVSEFAGGFFLQESFLAFVFEAEPLLFGAGGNEFGLHTAALFIEAAAFGGFAVGLGAEAFGFGLGAFELSGNATGLFGLAFFFGFGAAPGFVGSSLTSRGFACGGSLTLIFETLLFGTPHRESAGIFGALHGVTRHHSGGLGFAATQLVFFGLLEAGLGLFHDVRGVFVGLGRLGDHDGVAGLIELKGHLGIERKAHRVGHLGVFAALEQFKLGIDGFKAAEGILSQFVFGHDEIAGHGDGEVRLSGNNQAEGLEFGGDRELAAAVVELDFAEILRAALGGNGPEDIGEIFVAEAGGVGHAANFEFDFDTAGLAFHLDLAFGLGHEGRTDEVEIGSPHAVPVIDGFGALGHYVGLEGDGLRSLSQCANGKEK